MSISNVHICHVTTGHFVFFSHLFTIGAPLAEKQMSKTVIQILGEYIERDICNDPQGIVVF